MSQVPAFGARDFGRSAQAEPPTEHDFGRAAKLLTRAILRGEPASDAAPPVHASAAARPAPAPRQGGRRLWTLALVGASFTAHAVIYSLLDQSPPPLASVGAQAVSVELILGDAQPVGNADNPQPTARSQPQGEPEANTVRPPQADEAPTSAMPAGSPGPQAASPSPPPAAVPPAQAELAAEPKAAEPSPPLPPPDAKAKPAEPRASEPKVEATRELRRKPRVERQHQAALPQGAPERPTSGGLGRGRSDADTNYRGLVAAHLARYKQFPAEAKGRGEQGIATVSFRLDGAGRVTSVSLVRRTGSAALDREAEAMVHRASPFPAPPTHQAISFTVPVSFKLH